MPIKPEQTCRWCGSDTFHKFISHECQGCFEFYQAIQARAELTERMLCEIIGEKIATCELDNTSPLQECDCICHTTPLIEAPCSECAGHGHGVNDSFDLAVAEGVIRAATPEEVEEGKREFTIADVLYVSEIARPVSERAESFIQLLRENVASPRIKLGHWLLVAEAEIDGRACAHIMSNAELGAATGVTGSRAEELLTMALIQLDRFPLPAIPAVGFDAGMREYDRKVAELAEAGANAPVIAIPEQAIWPKEAETK